MKRLLYIVTLMSMILSCSKQDLKEPDLVASGEKIAMKFSVTVPGEDMATKAFGINPSIRTLHLAIFDAAGYFLEYITADIETTGTLENDVVYNYSANVTPTEGKTTIHFIANGPETVSFANETKLIGDLSTSGKNDAYWQRIVLDDGIKITKNAGGATASCNITTPVYLIRNFARIEVELTGNALNKYTLEKIYVANTPDKGSIAVYDSRKGEFLEGNKYIGKTHEDLYNEGRGYDAFVPFDASLQSEIPTSNDFVPSPFFVYEREYPLSNAAFILLEGTYHYDDINEKRYFKVDLRNSNGDYFPIFRNFIYKITITDLHHTGKTTIADAFEGAGSGDVSSNLDYKNFTNISNGHVQLYVSRTNVTMVNSGEEVELKYKFITFNDTGNGTTKTINNDLVEITPEINELTGAVSSYTVADADDSEGWRSVFVTAGNIIDGDEIFTTLRFTGTSVETDSQGNSKTYSIYREVEVSLKNKWRMTLACDDDHVLKNQGEKFDVVLGVPGGMKQALFPLDFRIEAANLSIAPDNDNLPTETGSSIIPNNNAQAFRFIKSLSWDEYADAQQNGEYKQIRCHFKTSKDISATEIWAANKYFTTESTNLYNYDPYEFTNLSYSSDPILGVSNIAVDFNFTMPVLAIDNIPLDVIVTLDGLEPVNDKLEYIGNNAENLAQYKYRPSEYNNTLKLRTTSANDEVNVTLEAYRYETASKSCDRRVYNFTGGFTGTTGTLNGEKGQSVSYRFTIPQDGFTTGMVVTVVLDGLEFATTPNTSWTDKGNGTWEYRPSTSGQTTINLQTTEAGNRTNYVTLSALGFNTLSSNIEQRKKETKSANLTFDNTDKRKERTNQRQEWEDNDIVFVNEKNGNRNSNVSSQYNPIRIYSRHKISISVPEGGAITKIVFDCSSEVYANRLKDYLGNSATVSSDKVTINLNGLDSEYVFSNFNDEVRLDAIIVTYDI